VSDRPRIGISACLLGEPVRYDAGHKRDAWIVDVLGPTVEWVPVCPEVEAGFGTPRETMRLVRTDGGGIALMTTGDARDVTERMRRYTDRRVEELAHANLDGFVLKADSPSCGVDGVQVETAFSTVSATSGFDTHPDARGLFAEALMTRLPHLPVADERRLANPAGRRQFVDVVFAHHRAGKMRIMPIAEALRSVSVVRVSGRDRASEIDRAATEEPLEVRLHGRPFAVIMRTPGADRELAAGFLLAERVVAGADDLGTIAQCTDPAADHRENIVNVTLANRPADAIDRLLAGRRQVTGNSSCGLCGRLTIESLASDREPIRSAWTIAASTVAMLPERLRARQAVFDETGGLHAAGLFTRSGELVDLAEDVGRHNAVDKIVGRMLLSEALPLSNHLLCVSGRTSFEIVQKAVFAGIPLLAAVSAPSSLAIELAEECGVTLVGFVRGDSFNIYAHPQRIEA
jgi:FdhD protein